MTNFHKFFIEKFNNENLTTQTLAEGKNVNLFIKNAISYDNVIINNSEMLCINDRRKVVFTKKCHSIQIRKK